MPKYNHKTALEAIVNQPKLVGIDRDELSFMMVEPSWYHPTNSKEYRMPDILCKRSPDNGFYLVELKSWGTRDKSRAKSQIRSGVDFIKEYFEWDYINPMIAYYKYSRIEHDNLPTIFR